ncbi:uncharacterized protein YALI1_F12523g [Yarrowia lipolytica]|uniref:Uncharacterized protein n=1 Tax=Yarrowia lipolytica TaxID=4952 RepID=A0A1D8NMM0_YARLL|nr:hypothetical protein YALI1_F12523g [Yarrowia lipolytica]
MKQLSGTREDVNEAVLGTEDHLNETVPRWPEAPFLQSRRQGREMAPTSRRRVRSIHSFHSIPVYLNNEYLRFK